MASNSRAEDVQVALQRAKMKISNLQQQMWEQSDSETSSECLVKTSQSALKKELRDSLVDMYSVNPKVNIELRQHLPLHSSKHLSNSAQRLSSPDRSDMSLEHVDCPQDCQNPQDCSSTLLHHRMDVFSGSPGDAGDMEAVLLNSQGPCPQVETCRDGPEGGRIPGSLATQKNLLSTEDSCHQVEFGPIVGSVDQDKNISFLLKELDALRNVNKKLLDDLVHKERELQRREVEEELREELREAQTWERPTAVLEEVLAAQKDRDQALMSRLLLANEERDEAVLHARQLQQASELDNVHQSDTDMDVDELLQCVCDADSGQEVQHFGSFLLQHLRSLRQRRNDIIAQEMKAVMEERDASVSAYKRLEQDLVQNQELKTSMEKLQRFQRDTGGTLEVSQQQEVELHMLHANPSPQDLLTPPPFMSSDDLHPAGQVLPPQTPPLLVQLQVLSKEKQRMEAELRCSQEAEQEASEKVRRLERLVDVLRKKVGTGSLRAVI